MRIAHFIQRYPPALGGSEAYFAHLSRYLAEHGDQVTVFTSAALDLKAFWSPSGKCLPLGVTREDGVDVRRYALLRWPGRRYFLKPLSLVPLRRWQCLTLPCNPIAVGMWCDAGQATPAFDLVHATAFPYAFPIACGLRVARRRRIPFVLTPFLHLGDPDDPHDRVRRQYTTPALLSLIRAADRVLVQTPGEHAALVRLGIPPAKLVLQGLGVEPAECTGGDRERARRSWDAAPEQVVIGHLANNSREKGTVDLLRAAERLGQQGVAFRLVLAGPEMPNFQAFWSRWAGRETASVLRLGVLDDTQKRDFFAGIDVFALPSRSDSFGLVLLEAWANGVPNVAYRAGGVADLIRDGANGFLAPCGDVAALAERLSRLIRDADLRRRLGRAGQERLPHEFDWEEKLSQVREVYAQLTGGRRDGQRQLYQRNFVG
jgi:glycosyltransferase involved in cell wall biosynthesis